ncbi:MAG: amidase [Deferrisomatales bacterium]|nr:amidase [Deferrisomatales bacterium]
MEVVTDTLDRIEEENPKLNAFVVVDGEGALEDARRLEAAIAGGAEVGPLAGVPVGVKDLEDVAGLATSFGSPMYRDNLASADSVQVARLKQAGAIVVGKTNTPEFGYTIFTKNRLFGVTRNPWNLERTPGGSSGGSAAAVAAGLVPLATGTDAGGSIRLPAAYCGCFGYKPSLGRIPAGGFPGPKPLLTMHPIAVSGPLCRCVEDAAVFLDCVAGYHPSDPGSLPTPGNTYLAGLEGLPAGLRIAFSPDLGHLRVQREVRDRVEQAAGVFEELGCRVELWPGTLPDTANAWSRLLDCDLYAQVCGDLEQRPTELSRSLATQLQGTACLGIADLLAAQQARSELNHVLHQLYDHYDLLLTPTVPNEAFAAAGPPPDEIEGGPIRLFELMGFTQPFNFSGHPAASVPTARTTGGLPVGLQIVAARHRDDLVLQAARAYQNATCRDGKWFVAG